MSQKAGVLLADEAPIHEMEELKPLIAEGQERGYLTYEEIGTCLEEIEVTKEQVRELHAHLEEHGIDVVEADGRPAVAESATTESSERTDRTENAPKRPEIDLTVEPSLDSLRLYLRSIRLAANPSALVSLSGVSLSRVWSAMLWSALVSWTSTFLVLSIPSYSGSAVG